MAQPSAQHPKSNPAEELYLANRRGRIDSKIMWKQILKYVAIGSGVAVAVVTFFQWQDAHHNFKVDERAWLGITTAPNYTTDPNGKIIVLAQLQNFGKTPARIVEGKAIGTIWKQGEEPDLSAEIKPPYTAMHYPVFFPTVTAPFVLPISHYYADQRVPVSPQEIADGKSYVIVYGQVTFNDIFGEAHWTHFCVSYPIPTKKCVQYNDTDGN